MLRVSEIGIVADDLTGACDVAGCFSTMGPVEVQILPQADIQEGSVVSVINTQTRLGLPEQVQPILQSVGRKLSSRAVIFKKIDTALRGPVGAELEGLLNGLGDKHGQWTVIVAPAMPKVGKITRTGVQYDHGMPIDKTDYTNDPSTPVHSADIAEIIHKTGHVNFKVCDAETDDDLARIVDESLNEDRIILVGSLGLACALAERIESVKARSPKMPSAERPMIVCGSQYERSHKQIKQAAAYVGAEVIEIHPTKKLAKAQIWPGGKKTPCFVCLSRQTIKTVECPHSEIIPHFVTEVMGMMQQVQPDGLGMIGGETAFHLLSQLKVTRLSVYGRMAEVIAFGVFADGEMAGRGFSTKGGSIGPDDAVVQMFKRLKRAS